MTEGLLKNRKDLGFSRWDDSGQSLHASAEHSSYHGAGLTTYYTAQCSFQVASKPMLLAKLQTLGDEHFLNLARVAIAATLHSPERAQNRVARMGEREEGLSVWIRAAQADGRLKPLDPEFAAQQLQGMLKSFAFWPQVSMGLPGLSPDKQHTVVESALDMFLACYQR